MDTCMPQLQVHYNSTRSNKWLLLCLQCSEMGVAELACSGWELKHPKCPQHNVLLSKYQTCLFMYYVSLVKVHKRTLQNSLGKAVELFYWTVLIVPVINQILLLVMLLLGIVLPLE